MDLLDSQNINPNLVLSPFKLQYSQLNNSDMFLPSHCLGHILDSTAHLTGSNLIGIEAAKSKQHIGLHPTLVERIEQHNSVASYLFNIAQLSHLQGSHFKVTIDYMDGYLRISHSSALSPSQKGYLHSHIYTTFRILKLIQLFLGSKWKPDYITLAPKTDDNDFLRPFTETGKVFSGAQSSYIPIRLNLDEMKITPTKQEMEPSPQAVEQVKFLTKSLIGTEGFGLEMLAHMFGISERSIQRLFSKQGTSFRHYFNETKIAKGQELLLEGKSVASVATILDFNEPANFTRAMKKQIGMTPTQFLSINDPHSYSNSDGSLI
ncbi:helix-turn-helix domain-containing protein [Vibrio crassostreae]|uniref:helix-turn-helix domain-containing protein n=1 Tax=Vibrio crassostreae TaxID=246167 RepID=UPI001B30B9EF|nr:AraC family transcriptional regulator [Vibrio crassostreae]